MQRLLIFMILVVLLAIFQHFQMVRSGVQAEQRPISMQVDAKVGVQDGE